MYSSTADHPTTLNSFLPQYDMGQDGDTSHWRGPILYAYHYDQLNRITGMDGFYGLDQTNNTWAGLMPTQDFKERVAYDANGNIQKYLRNNFGETGLPMDSLGYKYITNTNKLSQIRDSAADFVGGNYDLHNQPANNYAYDSIGNLIKDSIEQINGIKWNVYGKITEIDHATTTIAKPTKNIYYYYDAAGNRIGKKITRGDTVAASYTWYVRDASGNVMATYTASEDTTQALSAADLHVGEKHIYGSSRLGIVNANYSTDATTDGLGTYISPWTGINVPSYVGKKQYELTNHLGNVLATISDRKIGVSLTSDSSLIDHFEANVQTAQDYYPFGMIMPGRIFTALTIPGGSVTGTTQVNGYTVPVDLELTSRSGNEPTSYVASSVIDLDEGFESGINDDVTAYIADTSYAGTGNGGSGADGVAGAGKYRYGFNGKENDNEVKGVGDQIDYGMRVYDPRAGRFLSGDPITKKYPELTPYQFSSNTPIAATDVDGLEGLAGPPPGSIYAANKELYDDLLAGRNTPAVQNSRKAGAVIAVAGALALDAFITKGWASRTLFASQVFGAFPHNKAPTEEGRALQDQNSKEILADAFITWGSTKILGATISLFKGLVKEEAKYLFRGTSEGFEGSPQNQRIGVTPTTSDPVVATIFSIQAKNYGKGVLQIVLPKELQGVEYAAGNTLQSLEHEVVIDLKPVDLAKKAGVTITSDQARTILQRMGVNLPSRIKLEDVSNTIRNTPRLSPSQTEEFYKQAVKLQKSNP